MELVLKANFVAATVDGHGHLGARVEPCAEAARRWSKYRKAVDCFDTVSFPGSE
jgi:hypothetical protein